MERHSGILGAALILAICYALSNQRSQIKPRIVAWGLALQFLFALFILKTPFGLPLFAAVDSAIKTLLGFADQGADFLFKSFVSQRVETANLNIAFRVLPTIIFFSSLIAALFYLGVMQRLIGAIAKVMRKTLGTSGSETLTAAGNIFVGQTEAPLMVAPLLRTMTQSELMAMMTAGFATVSGGVMAVYVAMLRDIPGIAGHLLTASVMNAPAALLVAKMLFPETERSATANDGKIEIACEDANLIEAITRGAASGLHLALNVAAMLIAFSALLAMLNAGLAVAGLSLQQILGWLFAPLTWTMGIPWREAQTVGALLGEKIVLTEMIAYVHLADLIQQNPASLSLKSQIIASYALCGFANFASIGVQIGGISALVPERRQDLSKLGIKAMGSGTLASCLTAAIVGILL